MFRGSISRETFLAEYWQQKPLLIRQALPAFKDPLSAEELAGLACEEEVESRLVNIKNGTWHQTSGPFTEKDFTSLPEQDWTLLVQAVDTWFTELQELYQTFDFIPDWRFDDIMVSYACQNGGVGPHFDYYDVFILQGQGQRHWQLGQQCDENTPLVEDSTTKILKDFSPEAEYLLESGDVLYIPPGVSHQGTSIGESLSYSIGFRAPSCTEILDEFVNELSVKLHKHQRYRDPGLLHQKHPAEISASTLCMLTQIIKQQCEDQATLLCSFGRTMTQRKYPEQQLIPETLLGAEDFAALSAQNLMLEKHPAARFAFAEHDGILYLFADGEVFQRDTSDEEFRNLVMQLCDRKLTIYVLAHLAESTLALNLLCALYNQGSLLATE